HHFAGLFGIGVAVMAPLSRPGWIAALDAYGPGTDNAGGIAEMADLPDDVRAITDPLDAVGNTTKAVTKGYAIGSAALAALVLFDSYTSGLTDANYPVNFSLSDAWVVAGLFIGGLMPFLFASLAMQAVGRVGGEVVTEVRRQFRENPGIMEGTTRPEYGRAIDIVTGSAIRQMLLPALIPILFPVIVGIINARMLGTPALFATAYGNVGSSIYYALGLVAGIALGLTPLVFVISGLIFAATAATYAEGTVRYPEAGGSSSFARHAFNEFVSFGAAWAQMLNYVVTIAISAFFVPHYLSIFWEPLKTNPWD